MYFDNKVASIEQYLRKLSGQEKEPGGVTCDHNYVKPWSAHADSHRTKPAKMLFMNAVLRPKSVYTYPDEEIDVLNVSPPDNYSPFDSQKTKVLANELEHSIKSQLNAVDEDGSALANFKIEIIKDSHKRRIYKDVMNLINAIILVKMTYAGHPNEFIKRKLTIERCARQLRLIFANTFCDFDDLIFWIHKLVLDKGDSLEVSSYLSMLQALRTKVPKIVDKIVRIYSGYYGYEYLSQVVKKHWDPCIPVLNQHKPKKLPGNPFLIMTCAGFCAARSVDESPRFRFWINNLNSLCKTMYIPMKCDGSCTYEEALEESMLALKNKITEFKNHFPNRPVILAGWTIGALISCYVALETKVDAVMCFGFPLTGVNGSRGDLNDPLLESKVPTLFIVGQNSNMCSTDDIEDFRSRMRVESGLIIVGGADDLLIVSPEKLYQESITQEIVDRCILDEIKDFLQTTIVKLPTATNLMSNNPIKSCPTIIEENTELDVINPEDDGKRKRRRPKEYSPELTSSRKRAKHSTAKEIPNFTTKLRLSPSSSETSSSGSFKNEKQILMKTAKKNPEKRAVGRPPSGASRKKTPAKSIIKSVPEMSKVDILKTFKPVSPAPVITSLPKRSPITASKSALPFALNILPKKNDPVDVEKAFGKDSSFLPRPLTPPEPEDTISAEETEKAMAELEGSSLPPSGSPKLDNTSLSNPIPPIISSKEKTFVPLSEQSSIAILSSKTVSGSFIKPVLNSTSDTKKGIPVSISASPLKTVFQRRKVLSPGSGSVTPLKNIAGVNLTLSSPNNLNTSKSMITVPSNTILVSGQTLKTSSGKVLQLLSKGPLSLKTKDQLTSKLVGSINNNESSEQQSCNLSLLSDVAGMTEPLVDSPKKVYVAGMTEPLVDSPKKVYVAGMTEPLVDSPKKVYTGPPSATLVKLAVPEKIHSLKHNPVLKSIQVRSTSARIDTPEEMAEKQLAIQSLNNSVGLDVPPTPRRISEPGYAICYKKPDGSLIPTVVPTAGSGSYIRQAFLTKTAGRARGRVRPELPSRSPFPRYYF